MPHDRPESFQIGCFVVAEFLLTSALYGTTAIAMPLVQLAFTIYMIFAARRYSERSVCRCRVSVRPSVRPSANNDTHDRPETLVFYRATLR